MFKVVLFRENNFDLIRLFAAFQVLILHTMSRLSIEPIIWLGWLNNFPGVPIFFVISGFVVSASLERSTEFTRYIEKRARRIFLALWVCIWLTAIATILMGFDLVNLDGAIWILAQMFGAIYTPSMLDGFGTGSYNGSLWTIPVELQFYVLLPVSYWLSKRLFGGTVTVFILGLLFVFTCVAIVAQYVMPQMYEDTGPLWQKVLRYSFIPHVYLFFFGVAAQRLQIWQWPAIQGKFVWWLLAYVMARWALPASPVLDTALMLVLGVVTISAAYSMPGLSKCMRGQDISYGVYIYHGLIINLVFAAGLSGSLVLLPAVIGLTVVAAAASWFLVERPFLSGIRHSSYTTQAVLKAPA